MNVQQKNPNFVIMTNKSYFISCNPCTTQMQDADSGEAVCVCVCVCVWWGQGM